MQEFPLSKLKIKIHGISNPTSVFKKKSFLTLNCIQKTSKSKTPLRIFTNDELPHYMLPIKCQTNKTENVDKMQNKIKQIKPKIKLSILSRNKSDNEIKYKQNSNVKTKKVNNIYNTITFNKNNLNTNIFTNTHLNDYSSSNKDNNENIISELNIINHNNNNNNTSFEEPSFQSFISELQKKINEQNILLSLKNKEIERLKKQLNNNNINQNIDIYNNYNNINKINENKKEIENNKPIKDNNEINIQEKKKIIKLEEEIRTLKLKMEILNNKYQSELNNKKALEEQNTFLKNNLKNNVSQQNDKKKYESKIIQQENKILDLEEELKRIKNPKLFKSNEFNFEIISKKKELILNQKQYNDIQLILNVLLDINNIEKNYLSGIMGNPNIKNNGFIVKSKDLINTLKINEKDNTIVCHYLKDFVIKSKRDNTTLDLEIDKLYKYKNNIINKSKNEKNFVMNSKNKKIIYEKCKNYDYKNKHKIPFYYFKHLFKEICFKNKIPFSTNEFYNLIYECKKCNGNESYSLYDILYENLIEKEKKEPKINIEYKLKYPELVKNFLDKIIKEAYNKKRDNSGNNKLNRARSFEMDFYEQNILDNDNNSNKINLNGDD